MSQEKRAKSTQGRVGSIDLRIGINLLGEQGLVLLMQYIKAKSQRRDTMPGGRDITTPNPSLYSFHEKEAQLWQTRSSVSTRQHKTTI
jgi:hypothetical protein